MTGPDEAHISRKAAWGPLLSLSWLGPWPPAPARPLGPGTCQAPGPQHLPRPQQPKVDLILYVLIGYAYWRLNLQ